MQLEEFRETRVSDAKNDLNLATFGMNNEEGISVDDWPSLDNVLVSDYAEEYAMADDYLPAKPE